MREMMISSTTRIISFDFTLDVGLVNVGRYVSIQSVLHSSQKAVDMGPPNKMDCGLIVT